MERPLETIDLGDQWTFEANGRVLTARVTLQVYADDCGFDGDDPDDIAAYERGEFQMYVARVEAWFLGEVSGDDVLGGICARRFEDVTACMEEHDMVVNALSELADKVERLVAAATA